MDRGHAVVMTWRHQKIVEMDNSLKMLVDRDHPEVCPALAIARMAWRKAKLRRPMSKPLAIFKDKKGDVCYVTHSKVTEVIRRAIKKVYPDMVKKRTHEIFLPLN